MASLELALDAESPSPEMTQTLLNLAEFMEHNDKPLPIDIRKLGTLAEKCHAYAKARPLPPPYLPWLHSVPWLYLPPLYTHCVLTTPRRCTTARSNRTRTLRRP